MIEKYSDQSLIGIINNLNYGTNIDPGESKKISESQKILTNNNKLDDKIYSDSEKNAMIEMYAEIISVLVNHHFE